MNDSGRQYESKVVSLSRVAVKPLAVISSVGMWTVLIMGATVTNTGSQTGCGPSWPLCRGRFIPQFAVSTFIEFSHRAVVGIESVFIIAFAIAAWILYHDRRDIRLLAPTMVAFLFLQAGLGAWAVMAPQNAAVLALHFGVSLVAFASVVLCAAIVLEVTGWEHLRDRVFPARFVTYVWGLTIFSYAVVYLGAYVRHRNADAACTGWPLCNGSVIPSFHGLVGVAFGHRVAAFVLVVGVSGLVVWSARFRSTRPDLYYASLVAAGFVLLQALSGALVVATDLDLFSALAHAGFAALLFGALSYLCLHVSPLPVESRATAAVSSVANAAEQAPSAG